MTLRQRLLVGSIAAGVLLAISVALLATDAAGERWGGISGTSLAWAAIAVSIMWRLERDPRLRDGTASVRAAHVVPAVTGLIVGLVYLAFAVVRLAVGLAGVIDTVALVVYGALGLAVLIASIARLARPARAAVAFDGAPSDDAASGR